MTHPIVINNPDATLAVLDDRGTMLGTIVRPTQLDPLGPGREKVYLARRQRPERTAA